MFVFFKIIIIIITGLSSLNIIVDNNHGMVYDPPVLLQFNVNLIIPTLAPRIHPRTPDIPRTLRLILFIDFTRWYIRPFTVENNTRSS